jgi:hypothetical protein
VTIDDMRPIRDLIHSITVLVFDSVSFDNNNNNKN